MKTVILDDDPTGTQSASGVGVLLRWSVDILAHEFVANDVVYLLTNTRALPEAEAVDLVREAVAAARSAAARSGDGVRVVLRGDSTLRGHVFAEADAVDADAPMLFVPAFPEGGRTTIDGQHLVRIDGVDVRAEDTEFAADPVFGYLHGRLDAYVREKSSRTPQLISIDTVRDPAALDAVLRDAGADVVLLPDVHDEGDIERIAAAVRGIPVESGLVVRCGSPLAAAIGQVTSRGLLDTPLERPAGPVLLVCGSHTDAAGRQLARVAGVHGPAVEIDTDAALADPDAEGRRAAAEALALLRDTGFAVIASARARRPEHDTLAHGERVMSALIAAVALVRSHVQTVISKGGITGADVARRGLGAQRAGVRGQVLPGVSVWDLITAEGLPAVQIVVPGNVGDDEILVSALAAAGIDAA